MKTIKQLGVLFLTSICLQVNAEGFSPANMEQLKMQRLWLQSQNAAGMAFDDTTRFSNLVMNYYLQDGNFHRPQEGAKESTFGGSSEGFMK